MDKFIFLADFIVLGMEEDNDVPLIIGNPFLGTGWTLIDVAAGELIIIANDNMVVFNIFKTMKYLESTAIKPVPPALHFTYWSAHRLNTIWTGPFCGSICIMILVVLCMSPRLYYKPNKFCAMFVRSFGKYIGIKPSGYP